MSQTLHRPRIAGSVTERPDRFEPQRLGKFWDEINVGDQMTDYPDHAVTITEDMVVQFATLTGDLNPLHVDHEFGMRSVYRRTITHGAFLTSLAIGQYHRCGYTYGTILALSTLSTRFFLPAYVGDTLYVEMRVVGKSESAHPKRGMVNYQAWMRRSNDHMAIIRLDFELLILRYAGRRGLERLGVTEEILAKRTFRSDTDPPSPPGLEYP